jgi:hypothetical protein
MEVGTCHFTHGFQVLSPEPLEVSIRAHLDHREHGSWDLPLHTWVPSLKPLEVSIRAISTIESMEVGTCHFTHGSQVLSPKYDMATQHWR